jgi:hypothetical protein
MDITLELSVGEFHARLQVFRDGVLIKDINLADIDFVHEKLFEILETLA